jgi:two-component system, NarL family, response regulator DevR
MTQANRSGLPLEYRDDELDRANQLQENKAELASILVLVAEGKAMLDPRLSERVFERIRSDAKCRDELATLSTQERRILELIGEGCTNRQIGDALLLAEQTVKNYVTSILAKLGLRRRTEAAACLVGLIPSISALPKRTS